MKYCWGVYGVSNVDLVYISRSKERCIDFPSLLSRIYGQSSSVAMSLYLVCTNIDDYEDSLSHPSLLLLLITDLLVEYSLYCIDIFILSSSFSKLWLHLILKINRRITLPWNLVRSHSTTIFYLKASSTLKLNFAKPNKPHAERNDIHCEALDFASIASLFILQVTC